MLQALSPHWQWSSAEMQTLSSKWSFTYHFLPHNVSPVPFQHKSIRFAEAFPSSILYFFLCQSAHSRLFSICFPFPSLTSSPLTPNTWLAEIVIRHSFFFWSIALCAKLHISDLEWKHLLLDHGQRSSYFDCLHSILQLGTALDCPSGEAVCPHWWIICALAGCGLSLCRDTSDPKLQWQWCILGAAMIHDAGEGVLRASDKN